MGNNCDRVFFSIWLNNGQYELEQLKYMNSQFKWVWHVNYQFDNLYCCLDNFWLILQKVGWNKCQGTGLRKT